MNRFLNIYKLIIEYFKLYKDLQSFLSQIKLDLFMHEVFFKLNLI